MLVVAQALPEVAGLSIVDCMEGTAEVPASARAAVAFFRVWCLVRPPPAHRPPSPCVAPPQQPGFSWVIG